MTPSAAKPPCDCAICRHDHPFQLSSGLLDAILSGDVVVFAGAGISTESPTVLNTSFYETVAEATQWGGPPIPFPEMMDRLANEVDGKYKLLSLLRQRLDTIDAFPELHAAATRFHECLGDLHTIETIVTTNWDTYFEDVCRATPFVTDRDLAFWHHARRKVLKLHGSIRSLDSIVATSLDYGRCNRRLGSGIIGSILKSILATQTVVFVGYSLSDSDLQAVLALVKRRMGGMQKQPYVVTPFERDAERFTGYGFVPIITSGAHFVDAVRQHAVRARVILAEARYDAARELLKKLRGQHLLLHEAVPWAEAPQVIYAASYQDGLMHALERALHMRSSGEYSSGCRLRAVIATYLGWQRERRKNGIYEDVAYIEGYVNGLRLLLAVGEGAEEVPVPLYFAFGNRGQVWDLEQYLELVPKLPKMHKASHKRAQARLRRMTESNRTVFHHPPWL
jgi:hypothetical protein